MIASTGGFSLGMAFDAEENLYVCDNMHAAVFKLNTKSGELVRFADGNDRQKMKIPNFPVVDHKRSCLYVSDSYHFSENGPGIWKVDLQTGQSELWYGEAMRFANGLALAPDGHSLYAAETFDRRISRLPILENGTAGQKEEIARLEALPDGLAIDREGNIYASCYEPSRLYKITSEGEVQLLIDDPEAHTLCHPTNCAFKGTEMYTTNLGRWHITKFEVGIEGADLF